VENLQIKAARRKDMAREARTLKKVNKVLARVEKHIDQTRDALEDLEIEFEVLKATVKRLKAVSVQAEEPVEEVDEEIDIENSSNITVTRKF
jgi:ATP/maltotriose-dependent transcriptional regulator MalT